MPPKKHNAEGAQSEGAASPQTATRRQARVKKENDCDPTDQHSHSFKVKFSGKKKEYPTSCLRPDTVLNAIKSNRTCRDNITCADENIIIQMGEKDKECIIATHFPCSCIREGESLTILCGSEKIEHSTTDQGYKEIHPRDKYSVFYIDRDGGKKTTSKQLFREKALKILLKFKYLCVYGEKGETVEDALRRDGRFIDNLSNFHLSDNDNPDCLIDCTQRVDNLHQKRFKIRLPRQPKEKKETPSASNTRPVLDVVHQRGTSVEEAIKTSQGNNDSVQTEEIYEILREQFPNLKQWMEERFPGNSYQEELNLKRENFGKIQQSFSEVHRVRKLLKLGESVCKIIVHDVCEGTGFVLFDNFILTNAHLFKNHIKGEELKNIDVLAVFNYDDPEPHTNFFYFSCKKKLIDFDEELDYAVLELSPEGQKPPGLLNKFGPVPEEGEACIIGHPGGKVKTMDPTQIIETKNSDCSNQYKDTLFTLLSINNLISSQGIENIMMGGSKADKVVTYDTCMYHGSSGSPVFDGDCRVFGLHTAGFVYGFPTDTKSVIEFAFPLLTIFEKFVSNLKNSGKNELLDRVESEASENIHLQEVLEIMQADAGEPIEVD